MDWLSLIGPPAAAILVLVVLVVLLREKRDDSVTDLEGERDQSTAHLSSLLGYEPADLGRVPSSGGFGLFGGFPTALLARPPRPESEWAAGRRSVVSRA